MSNTWRHPCSFACLTHEDIPVSLHVWKPNSQEIRLGPGQQTNGGSISGRDNILSFLTNVNVSSAVQPYSNEWVPGDLSPGIKRTGHKSSAEVQNKWSYTSITPCPFMVHMSSWRHVQAQGWTDMAKKCSSNISGVKTIYSTIYSPSLIVRIKNIFYTKYLKIQGLNVMIGDQNGGGGAMISFLHFTRDNKKLFLN